jgi:hypothetical protein
VDTPVRDFTNLYLRVRRHGTDQPIGDDTLSLGFRATVMDESADLPELLAVVDRALTRARRHATIVTGHALCEDLAQMMALSEHRYGGSPGWPTRACVRSSCRRRRRLCHRQSRALCYGFWSTCMSNAMHRPDRREERTTTMRIDAHEHGEIRRETSEPLDVDFAFYGRVSTEDNQDPESSRHWQLTRANALIGPRNGRIVVEFFDIGDSRSLPWQRRPEARLLLAALRDPNRGFHAVVIGEPHRW